MSCLSDGGKGGGVSVQYFIIYHFLSEEKFLDSECNNINAGLGGCFLFDSMTLAVRESDAIYFYIYQDFLESLLSKHRH